jgi:hypothetical protein
MSFEREKKSNGHGPIAAHRPQSPGLGTAWRSGPKPQARLGRPRGSGPFSPCIRWPLRGLVRSRRRPGHPGLAGGELMMRRHHEQGGGTMTLFCGGGVLGSHHKGVGNEGAIRWRRWSAGRGFDGQWLAPEVHAASHEEDDGEGRLKS